MKIAIFKAKSCKLFLQPQKDSNLKKALSFIIEESTIKGEICTK